MVTFINAIRVPREREAEFLAKWDRGAEYVRGQPGLIWTSLQRALDPAGPFQYFTVAVWESEASFEAATSTSWWRAYVAEFGLSRDASGFGVTPVLCEVARSGGPFRAG